MAIESRNQRRSCRVCDVRTLEILISHAFAREPQLVTRNGRPAVGVVSARECERLTSPQDLVTFLRDSPLAEALDGGDLKLDRSADYGRDIEI